MKGRCWNCGHYTRDGVQLCGPCKRGENGHVIRDHGWCIAYGIKKSDLVDHSKVYAPCP